jgi:hypothetical protein
MTYLLGIGIRTKRLLLHLRTNPGERKIILWLALWPVIAIALLGSWLYDTLTIDSRYNPSLANLSYSTVTITESPKMIYDGPRGAMNFQGIDYVGRLSKACKVIFLYLQAL